MPDKEKKHDEQRQNAGEEQIEAAVENALKDTEEEGAMDVNVYKCA